MAFYKTLETVEVGPTGWSTGEDVFSTRMSIYLERPHLAPEYGGGETGALVGPAGTTQTLTFTAPEDLTLRRLLVYPSQTVDPTNNIMKVKQPAFIMGLQRLVVASGTGPDVGLDIYEGTGAAHMAVFDIRNVDASFDFDIRMEAGDVLEMDITVLADINPEPVTMIFNYDRGIDLLTAPKLLLGSPTPLSGLAFGQTLGTSGTATSRTLLVNNAPTTSELKIQEHRLSSAEGQSVTITGTPGGSASQYDSSLLTANDVRNSLFNVLTVTHPEVGGFLSKFNFSTFIGVGITIQRANVGVAGNYDLIESSNLLDFVFLGPTTGTSVPTTARMTDPSVGCNLIRLYAGSTISFSSSPFTTSYNGIHVPKLQINAVDVPIGGGLVNPDQSMIIGKKLNVPIDPGDTIDVFSKYEGTNPFGLLYLGVAERL